MASLESIVMQMKSNPNGVRFRDLCKVCDAWFGMARNNGSSHRVYRTPWKGDPRINIQKKKGMAKAYQVRQVLNAIALIEERNGKGTG